jgi:hypothetical protein
MTDKIIEMAREAGFDDYEQDEMLKRFAALVRADERKEMQAESEADKTIIEYHEATIKRLKAELKARGNT